MIELHADIRTGRWAPLRPGNSDDLLSRARPGRTAVLLVTNIRPSSRKQVKAASVEVM
jgi:hypothetical protein